MKFFSHESPSLVVASNKKEWFFAQFALLILFIAGDIFINATAEYESLNKHKPSQQLHTLLFLGQIILQFCIATILCLSLFNTFPFQVGVWYHFKTILMWFLIFQLIYLILSCTGMRLSHNNTDVWSRRWFYSTVSFLHVLGEKELVVTFIHSFIHSLTLFFIRT